MNTITATENTLHNHNVSRFLIRDLEKIRATAQRLAINFDNEDARNTAREAIAKDFRKQKMQPKGEIFNIAFAYVTGW